AGGQAGGAPSLALPLGLAVLALAGTVGLYARLGAPFYADLPHAGRVARAEAMKANRPTQAEAEGEAARTRPAPQPPAADYARLMEELRAAVAKRPDDGTGLRLLADNERKLGNLEASARTEEQLVKALGAKATAADHAALADSLVTAAGGIVTARAEAAIVDSLTADKSNGIARFYAGLLEAQTGRPDRAFLLWRDLRKESAADAPWVPYIDSQMEMLAAAAGATYVPPDGKGPQSGDMAAAAQMSPEERAQMIKGMVAGLEERLFTTGGSAAEWAQLMTALGVLGDKDRAKTAWTKAQAALAGDRTGLDQVKASAKAAGVAIP
ncbi:MAG: c-type cytochrome biogenesis protein CcmI, partial [Rhodobacteraceae bacterium]|nr:c-type cytochrome biogenesis protein CcmI [Paracoccaceae bacterium]